MRDLTLEELDEVSGAGRIEDAGESLMMIGVAGVASGAGASLGAFAMGMGFTLKLAGAYYQM